MTAPRYGLDHVLEEWREVRRRLPDAYIVEPQHEAERQAALTVGLVGDVFNLAATTIYLGGPNYRWQRDLVYQLAQRLQQSAQVVRALDDGAGGRKGKLDALLNVRPPEKINGVYLARCHWCGRGWSPKRCDARFCENTCNQAWLRQKRRLESKVLNGDPADGGGLHLKLAEDMELIGAIRSIALVSFAPRGPLLNRAASVLEEINADLIELAAQALAK